MNERQMKIPVKVRPTGKWVLVEVTRTPKGRIQVAQV